MSSSTFTWLAYDDAERDQVAALVRALDEPETLDSLGLGIVRDTIADLLFPGTSTIQTRVRYFVLVARAVVEVERSSHHAQSITEFAAEPNYVIVHTSAACRRPRVNEPFSSAYAT